MNSNQKYSVEDLLIEAQNALDKVNKASEETIEAAKANKRAAKFLKWIMALTVLAFLGLYTDIKIDLGTKADAKEVQELYITKKNANVANKLVQEQMKEMLYKYSIGDTTLDLTVNYEWIREAIFDETFRGGK